MILRECDVSLVPRPCIALIFLRAARLGSQTEAEDAPDDALVSSKDEGGLGFRDLAT